MRARPSRRTASTSSAYLEEFDEWAQTYINPFEDLAGPDAVPQLGQPTRRVAELEADGIVAEVLFPNTIPPFFPSGALVTPQPTADEYERRWAGLQAHNRWLVDFCEEAPGRRAGIAQILLNDVDDAVAEMPLGDGRRSHRWRAAAGRPARRAMPPLSSDEYEPIWAACEELDVVGQPPRRRRRCPTFVVTDPAPPR